jgi:hypothetical protein
MTDDEAAAWAIERVALERAAPRGPVVIDLLPLDVLALEIAETEQRAPGAPEAGPDAT